MTDIEVPASLHGERVDRGLALLTGVTRSQAARLVAAGHVRVGGHLTTSGSRRLNKGEHLHLEHVEAAGEDEAPSGGEGPGGGIVARVVYADDDVVVVDKPAGLVVHPGAGNASGTLVQQLLSQFPDISSAGPQGDRPGIVHRIDKGTSGLLMVARNPAARANLTAQLAARSVERRYLALVHGELGADEGIVDAPLGRSQRDRVKVAVVEGGRSARTHYRALASARAPLPATLVACRLETGRTHQVRVHMAAIGHPVVHDDRYAKPSLGAAARKCLPELRRPWLHAAVLGFTHPVSGERLVFAADVPADLLATLPVLGLSLPADATADW